MDKTIKERFKATELGFGNLTQRENLIISIAEQAMQEERRKWVMETVKERSDKITLLESYSLFLEKDGYMDIDWRAEEPYAIDEFLKPKEQ